MTNPIAPKEIILFSNGMVMAFDVTGEQMPECQGTRSQAIQKLQGVNLSNCKFSFGVWGVSSQPITQAQFFDENWLPMAVG